VTEPKTAISSLSIADTKFRRSFIVLRWLLLAVWIGLIRSGTVDVSGTALLASSTILIAWNAWRVSVDIHLSRTGVHDCRASFLASQLDVVIVTVVLITLQDARNPMFVLYFIGIASAAHLASRWQMRWQMVWVNLNFLAFVGITAGTGHGLSWGYVAVVTIAFQVRSADARIFAGAEQRLRDLIVATAATDSLTGLPNRRRFHEAYPTSFDEAIASRTPLALMLIDFDHFKQINDRDGHPAGDDKLRDVAQALQSALRANDLVARYGGDEFIVVAPHSTRKEALALAERLRIAAETCDASISIGIAIFPEDAHQQDALIEAADAALYRAKQAGRNCIREFLAA
jgi:diguanylate cyclase (GGDEF)-like protein